MDEIVTKKRVLVVYFSFSSQTRNLIRAIVVGLKKKDIDVQLEIIKPVEPLHFPLKTFYKTIKMMIITSFRWRVKIEPINDHCFEEYDLVLFAGPTWSYNPSGPILSFLDRYGNRVLQNRNVMPLISCRGYWRLHCWGLNRILVRCGAKLIPPIIFTHTTKEPWRTIGVFLKLAGKVPEAGKSWFRKYYPKYGHSRQQLASAEKIGQAMGDHLNEGKDIDTLTFPIPIPYSRNDRL